jgi:hypothetical protein
MPQFRRYKYGMTLTDSGSTLLVCGGYVDYAAISNCSLYNIASNVWTTFPSLPVVMANFVMITIAGDSVFVFGNLYMCGSYPFAVLTLFTLTAN